MIRLAWKNLMHSKARLAISIGGVGLALLLILALDAVFAGAERTASAYIDRSRADVIVSQSGVRNMHMASSSLPATLQSELEAVPGVTSATPILYLTNVIEAGEDANAKSITLEDDWYDLLRPTLDRIIAVVYRENSPVIEDALNAAISAANVNGAKPATKKGK